MESASPRPPCSRAGMALYASGECANSLIMNSLFGFAMLYYTDALGLSASLVGIAMSVATFWDAVSDPVMGHLTDATRSRFGRRHPYLVLGAIGTAATFFALWHVPDLFRQNTTLLFSYLVAVNLLQRTAITVFIIPYIALGFEICPDYHRQAVLQGWRTALGMVANLCGPALAWTIFFSNNEKTRATRDIANYEQMGTVFAVAGLVLMLFVVFATRSHITDSRGLKASRHWVRDFSRSLAEIWREPLARAVLLFTFAVIFGAASVSTLQMYVFEHVLELGGFDKTLAHGGTMVGAGLGALLSNPLTARFEKRGALFVAIGLSFGCACLLVILFTFSWLAGPMAPFTAGGARGPFFAFVALHSLYWLGNGVVIPVGTSMVADVAECARLRTGTERQGAFAALHSFAFKLAMSLAMLTAGFALDLIGFQANATTSQTAGVRDGLVPLAFLIGPSVSLVSLLLIRRHPVDRAFLSRLHEEARTPAVAASPVPSPL